MNIKTTLAAGMAMLLAMVAFPAGADDASAVAEGREVAIEYTLTLDDGTLADSNVGEAPYVYVQGQQQILAALEAALVGLVPGDSREVRISAEDGYGPVDPEMFQEVPLEAIPEDGRQVGEVLVGADPNGQPFQVRVAEVRDDAVVVDFNHPLAGQTLNFAVKVLAVN